jgi:rubrerythrin
MEDTTKILEGLKTAMEAELTGLNFYKNASQTTLDPKGKEAFLRMASEEEAHFKYLRRQYQSILEKGGFDFARSFVKESHEQNENPIFSHAIKDRIKDCHFEVSVLTIGMKLELEAIHFYQSCAQKAESPEEKQFYQDMVDWETRHYEALEWELNELKEGYWQANNFVPMA